MKGLILLKKNKTYTPSKIAFLWVIIMLVFCLTSNAQAVGDYRSAGNGNWSALTSWQIFDGTNWVTPSAAQGYPGQFPGTGNVTIYNGHQITLNVSPPNTFSSLTVTGVSEGNRSALLINGNRTLLTTNVLLINFGEMIWTGNFTLSLPENTALVVLFNGRLNTDSPCNNNKRLRIGNVEYAACTGQGNVVYTFAMINEAGGVLRAIVTASPDELCYQQGMVALTTTLTGSITGLGSDPATHTIVYNWTVSFNVGPAVSFSNQLNPPPQVLTQGIGTYTFSLTVTSTHNASGFTYSTTSSLDVVVFSDSQGGSLAPNQEICFNSLPGTLTLTGYFGEILYWQKSNTLAFTSPVNISNTSNILTGAAIGLLTETTYFRAVVQNEICEPAFSVVATITVFGQLTAGTAQSSQTICQGEIPAQLIAESPSGGSGTFEYQWQVLNGGVWENIPGANTLTYQPGALIATTQYRLRQTDTYCNPDQTVITNIVTITVSTELAAGFAGDDQEICSGGTPEEIIADPPVCGTGDYSYQWQVFSGGTWVNITGANLLTYQPGALTVTTQYRLQQTDNGTNQVVYTNTVNITVYELVCEITGTEGPVCPGELLVFEAPLGMDAYQWTIVGNATIVGANNLQSVTIAASSYSELDGCLGSFTLSLTIYEGGCESSCQLTILIQPPPTAQFINPPGNITISCDQATSFAASSLSYTNAGLGGCLISGSVNGVITGTFDECGGTLTQTWTFTDDCNRTITHVQTITVQPAPVAVWINPPGNITISCDDATAFAASSLSYSNAGLGGCLIEGQVLGVITGTFDECGGTLTQTWTYTDDCGRISTQTQTITATPAPQAQFAAVDPVTLTCDQATTFAATNLTYTNTGLGGCLIEGQVLGVITGTFDECGGTLTQTWTFTDDCGRISTQTQTITVTPAPQAQFAAVDPVTLTCDQATTFAATNLTYTNTGLGGCLIEGQVLGVITGTFDECGGTLTQAWTYTDDCGRISTQTQTITVTPAPQAQFAAVDPVTLTCDQATTFAASQLQYSNTGLGGCLFEGQVLGVITGTFDECGGTLTQTWTYTDDCGRISTQTQTITVTPAPQAQFAAVDPVTLTCDQATTFAATNLTYTNTGLGGCLIEGQVLGVITGTFDECGGTLTQTWTFTDDCDRTITQTQTITVQPAPVAVWINPPGNITISCDDATAFAASSLSYSNTGLGGCLIEGQVLGVITGTFDECGGTLTQTWTYTDDCGRISTQTQIITVLPAPQAQFVAVDPIEITCDAATTFAASQLQYSNAGLGGCLIEGQVLGVISGTYDECGGTLTQTWTFTDDCNRTITQVQTITVQPAPAAAFINPPADISISCDNATTFAASSLSYSNAGLGGCLISGSVNGVITGTYDECGGTLTQTWTFTDDCDRTITHVQTITVQPAPVAVWINPPGNITISCDQATSFAASSLSYTNAGLGGCLISGSVNGVITGTYDECGGTLTQTWTFTDDCDRTITHVQTIIVQPAPVAAWINPPGNITISCDQATSFAASSLSYTNAGLGGCLISGSVNGVITGTYDECGGTLTQTWTFTDDCDRTITHVQTITVQPAPVAVWINPPGNITISCDQATSFAASSLSYTNAGLGGCLISGSVNGVITGTYDECGGTLTQTWTFTDDCNRTITHVQTITVQPAPVAVWINPPGNITISCDDATAFAASSLSYSNAGLGGCLIEGQVLGVITGTYDECGGTLTQTWTFTDDCDRISTQTQIITVLPAPQAQFVAVDPIEITCDAATTFAASQLQYSNAGLGGCLIEGEVLGVITGTYDECGGTLTQTWTFTDDCGRISTQTQTITVTPAPQAQFAAVDPVTLTCDQATTFAASQLQYSNTGLGGCLIEGQVLGVITGTFDECGGTLTQTWTYTDDCGRISTQTQTITVTPAPQAQFAAVDPVTLTCDQATTFAATNLTYTNTGLGGCLIEGQVLGVISGTFDECGGTLTQTWTFTDDCDRTITQTQTITVQPAPVAVWINPPGNITISCDDATAFAASSLSYSNAGLGGCLIEGQVLGVITGTFDECGGTLTQTWTFTDDCDRTITQTQTITVQPAPVAVWINPPGNITISCDDATAFAASSLSYSNAGLGGCLIEGSVTGEITGTYDECGGTLTQTWTFTDDCDRTITHTQTITVQPAPAAAFINPPADITISCDNATTFAASSLSYSNAGLGGCLIEGQVLGVITGTFDECGGTLTQTWTFTDDCNRTITHVQTITVQPAPAAAFINPPADITISCDNATTFAASSLSYSNAGLGGCLISGSVNGVITGTYDECGGTLTQTWTFTDDCDRTITQTQTITVQPAPVAAWINPPGNITISCDDATAFAASSLSYSNAGLGGCLIEGQLLGVITGTFDECGGTLTQTWTFIDDCNRTITHVQTITVQPAPAAAFINPPADITISCDNATTFAASSLSYSNAGLGGCLIEGQVLGVISGTYDECGGTLTQTWTFTDDCDRTITHTQTITVQPAPVAVWINPPGNITISCDQATSFAASSLSYTNAGLGGCLISGSVNGVITGTYDECGGTLTQTWTFTDDCDRISTQTQIITVLPAPQAQFVAVDPIEITCDAATTFAASQLQYSNAGLGGCLIEGEVLGVITGTYDECGGTLTQTWTFTDDCDRTITHTSRPLPCSPLPLQFGSIHRAISPYPVMTQQHLQQAASHTPTPDWAVA
jgi:hypothetical protein